MTLIANKPFSFASIIEKLTDGYQIGILTLNKSEVKANFHLPRERDELVPQNRTKPNKVAQEADILQCYSIKVEIRGKATIGKKLTFDLNHALVNFITHFIHEKSFNCLSSQ